MRNPLRIPATLQLICKCWNKAEEALRQGIKNDFPDIDEEAITQNFHAQLSASLRAASGVRAIESAFLSDLRSSSLRHVQEKDLRKIAHGLVADVSLHRRDTEKVTGGDFGFVIIRPDVQSGSTSLKIDDYRRGILTQAKLKRADGSWGTFTPNQEKVLPERLEYLSLLLYSYEDNARHNLRPFSWRLCNGFSFDQVKDLLKREQFQSSLSSCEIIKGLGNAKIGTDKNSILDDVISPAKNPSLIIRIHWPDGEHPGSEVRVYTRQESQQKAVILRHR